MIMHGVMSELWSHKSEQNLLCLYSGNAKQCKYEYVNWKLEYKLYYMYSITCGISYMIVLSFFAMRSLNPCKT